MLNVYLAGKMSLEHGNWREAIIGTGYSKLIEGIKPNWVLPISERAVDLGMPAWPQGTNSVVLGLHNYIGPYKIIPHEWSYAYQKHAGQFHGITWDGEHGCLNDHERACIIGSCLSAIGRADIVFAYINPVRTNRWQRL